MASFAKLTTFDAWVNFSNEFINAPMTEKSCILHRMERLEVAFQAIIKRMNYILTGSDEQHRDILVHVQMDFLGNAMYVLSDKTVEHSLCDIERKDLLRNTVLKQLIDDILTTCY